MLDVIGLLTVSSAFFVVAASPGPATLAAATVSMNYGRKSGFQFGMGLSVGLALWGLVAATGMGAILQSFTYALTILKLFGGAYLLWLAYISLRSARQATHELAAVRVEGNWFRRGLFLNLSNPKAVIAWMATLSLGVVEGQNSAQVITATGLCVFLGFLIYSGYILAFSTNGAMLVYSRLRRWIDGVVAGFFALAGFALIKSAFSR